MYQLIAEALGQQISFIYKHACGGACACLQHIGHHPGVIQVPVAERNGIFKVYAAFRPGSPGHFILKPKITILHYIINAHPFIPVVIIIGLP